MSTQVSGDRKNLSHQLAKIAVVVTLCVVVLGAYVRLSDAGLGCPDWPGCFGQMLVPEAGSAEAAAADAAYPERALENDKAWKEMIHRYVAGGLGILILLMCIISWVERHRYEHSNVPAIGYTALVFMVAFQAALGMWTVTLLLKPFIVSLHLLGGMTILGMLWWLVLRQGLYMVPESISNAFLLRRRALIALILLVIQIALGAWTSTNYAALVCPDFPTCQGQWWPAGMHFKDAFVLWRGLGVDYEGGVLAGGARTAIHVVHRVGALVVTLWFLRLSYQLFFRERDSYLNSLGLILFILLLLQIGIAVYMVSHQLPLIVATAHNAVAALLLMAVIAINHSVRSVPRLRSY